jgi:1,4-alpha-glucan branching enzyme
MLTKTLLKSKKNICKVLFELPATVNAQTACVVGEFNDWDTRATPMKRKRDGSFAVAVNLATERAYRFRYLLDDERWENETRADRQVPNDFGSTDSVIAF